MSDFPTVVAWAWGDRKYHDAAERLRGQCEAAGYDHWIVRDPPEFAEHQARRVSADMRDRIWVYRFIPTFILLALARTEADLLYLHADQEIVREVPFVFDGLDIGLESAWCNDRPNSVIAAPVFVRNNDRARRFVRLWQAHGWYMDDDRAEHHHLIDVWRYMERYDRTLRIGTFDPPIASIKFDTPTPIRGHK